MAKYKIIVDQETCVADRLCVEDAPETFDLDEDNELIVVDAEGDEPRYILRAARNCPVDAITLIDTETGEKVWPKD